MAIQLTPILILYFISGIITLFFALESWRRRPAPGAVYWMLVMLSASLFVLASGLEVFFVDPVLKMVMIRLIYTGVAGVTINWILFCFDYTQHDQWINLTSLALLSILPVTTVILILFVDRHQWIYRQYEFVEINGLVLGQVVEYGLYFYIWAFYGYMSIFSGALLVIRYAWYSPDLFQGQAIAVVISMFIPILTSIPYILGINPIAPLDPTPFTITLSGIVMYIGMSRFSFFNVTPVGYNLVFDHMVSGVIILDTRNHISNMNQAAEKIFGQQRDTVVGQPIHHIFPHFETVASQNRASTSFGDATYELKIEPLYDHSKTLIGRMVMLNDISAQLQLQKQEIQLAVEHERVQFLRQFISDASHDLKTPLSIMKTTHYLLRRQIGDHTAGTRLDILDEQTNRLAKLVEDMLLMVRLEDVNDMVSQPTDLNRLLRDIINSHPVPDGHTIQFIAADSIPTLELNQSEMTQAISHLLKNAITYTAPHGDIIVSTEVVEDSAIITIRDSGKGISTGDLPHIFERFYRADKARGTSDGSSGLGLAIVKRIIERHGGTIEVTSEAGKGTEFRIWMPARKQAPTPTITPMD